MEPLNREPDTSSTGKMMNELTQRRMQVDSLREQLAAVTQERDEAKLLVLQLSRDERSPVQDHLLFSNLIRQLTAKDQRIAELEQGERLLNNILTILVNNVGETGQSEGAVEVIQRKLTELATAQATVARLREALAPLNELRITAEQIELALKRLGPIALRDEAYVQIAAETCGRMLKAQQALAQAP